MAGFKIYNASAGSGKTFNLASNYIFTAVVSGFENILAVTFTNAAAKEMKDRIIDVLRNISQGKKDSETVGYINNLKTQFAKHSINISDALLQQKSQELLTRILHNYSFFNISTIDSFFQLVLKNLTKELGVVGNYMLSLNAQKYDELAVKTLVTSLKEDDEQGNKIFEWLANYFDKIHEDHKTWNIEKTLNAFVKNAFGSDDVSTILQNNAEDFSLEQLDKLRKSLVKSIVEFEKILRLKREKFLKSCESFGLKEADFKEGRKGGVYKYIKQLPQKIEIEEIKNRHTCEEVYNETNDIIEYIEKNYDAYRLNKIYYANIYPLGVLKYISDIKSDILKQDNIFVLNDTASFLDKLNEGDVPFVFEKISQRVDNIFIDEFQDTNRASFRNLEKLMNECVSSGGKSDIFGDIKQSIYRFNGGDYTIMQGEVDKIKQSDSKNVIELQDNFRSLGNVVEFNNNLFGNIYKEKGIDFQDQKVRREENKGIVRVQFAENRDAVIDYITREIKYYNDKGYDLNDIAILFRSNVDLVSVAKSLKDAEDFDYNPVSDVAFKFSSSLAVSKIIETLKYIDDKKRVISKEIINSSDENIKRINALSSSYKTDKSLLELVMNIAVVLDINDDAVFLPAFYDNIKDYTKNTGGNLTDFLDYWDEALQERNVDMSGVKAGVHLTSIHKSKGLAYKVVIVPYCDSSFYKSSNIWVKSCEDDALPIFSAMSSSLEDTKYNDEFEKENHAQYMDTINLMYVAFTRSRDNLSVISTMPSEKAKSEDAKSLNTLLFNYVNNSENSKFVAREDNLYIYKNCEDTLKSSSKSDEGKNDEILIDKIEFSDNVVNFAKSNKDELEEYFNNSYQELSQKEIGTKYHTYISNLIKAEDKQNILLKAEQSKDDTVLLEEIIDKIIETTSERHWFDDTYSVLNERAIISFDEANELVVKRPDRIMYNDKNIIVVDYKFGKKQDKYKKQVHHYMNLLGNVRGFEDKEISGYLFYINIEQGVGVEIEKC